MAPTKRRRKTCTVCGLRKTVGNFYQRTTTGTDGYRSECKECTRENRRRYTEKNLAAIVSQTKESRRRMKAYIHAVKALRGCKLCGERNPLCLDFHHRDPAEKDAPVSRASREGWGHKRLDAEIAKCDVLCANCHRKLPH